MAVHAITGVTVADLEGVVLPEGWRCEIIDGELHVSTQPHVMHQFTCNLIAHRLPQRTFGTGDGVLLPSPGVIFDRDEAVAPDLAWFASSERFEAATGFDGKLHTAPDLVVEVLSPGRENERRDRELKLDLYARRGVAEYWIADWRARALHVFRREGGRLREVLVLGSDDTLTSPLMPGFAAPVRTLFPPTS